jgi:hypothetical protein
MQCVGIVLNNKIMGADAVDAFLGSHAQNNLIKVEGASTNTLSYCTYIHMAMWLIYIY